MNDERSTVVAVFENRDQVRCAEDELRRAGFRPDEFGMAMRGEHDTLVEEHGTQGAAGLAGGAVAGGVLGGLLGAAASLLLPGVGPVLAAGILGTTLAGAATGAVAGGLLGALVGLGVPEEEARYYDREFQSGRIIVTTHARGRYQEAYDILHRCGAYDMHTQGAESFTRKTASPLRDEQIRIPPTDEETRMNYEGDPNVPGSYDNTDDRDAGEGI